MTASWPLKSFMHETDSWHFFFVFCCISGRERKLCPFSHFHALLFFLFFSVCRMSHFKAFSLQSKLGRNSHSSNRYVCVVFAHGRDAEKRGRWVILAVFGLPSKPSCHPWAVPSPTQRPGVARGRQNPCRINTKSSNGARGGETNKI